MAWIFGEVIVLMVMDVNPACGSIQWFCCEVLGRLRWHHTRRSSFDAIMLEVVSTVN